MIFVIFVPLVLYRYDRFLQSYEVDNSRLHQTLQVDAPLCSAYELDLLFHDPATMGTDYSKASAYPQYSYGYAAYPEDHDRHDAQDCSVHDRHRHVEHMYMTAAV